MRKIFVLLASIFLLAGCAETMALLGPATGAANGKFVQSSIQSGISYGIKKQTGKSPFEHALNISKKTDETICDTLKKENPVSCNAITNQLTAAADLKSEKEKEIKAKTETLRVFALAVKLKIEEESKIKYLD